MNINFRKAYPVGNDVSAYRDVPKVIAASGTTNVIDLSVKEYKVEENIIIQMSNTAASTVTLSNPQIGQTIILEQTGSGVENHAVTLSGVTIDATGNNVATTNAIDESLVLMVISATRLIIVSNNGGVALS